MYNITEIIDSILNVALSYDVNAEVTFNKGDYVDDKKFLIESITSAINGIEHSHWNYVGYENDADGTSAWYIRFCHDDDESFWLVIDQDVFGNLSASISE